MNEPVDLQRRPPFKETSGNPLFTFIREHLVLILGFIVAGLIVMKGLIPDMGTGPARMAGKASRDFTLTDLDGQKVSLASFRGNSVVILDFWATWCPPCRMTMPVLQRLKDQLGSRGLVVLSIDQRENPAAVRSYIQQNSFTMRILMDTDGGVSGAWGVNGLPTLLVIDKEGVVRHQEMGYESGMEARLFELVSGLL